MTVDLFAASFICRQSEVGRIVDLRGGLALRELGALRARAAFAAHRLRAMLLAWSKRRGQIS